MNHIDGAKEQLSRKLIKDYPTLKLNTPKTESWNQWIKTCSLEDYQIDNYKPQKSIKLPIAV